MSRRKSNKQTYWVLGIGVIILVLVLALWVWPTYIVSPVSIDSDPSSIQLVDGHIDVEKAHQKRQGGAYMLDVRTEEEWNEGHIPGATLIPLDQLSQRYGELPTDQEVVIYCRTGNRSGQALNFLMDAGFSNIYSMDGGINDWISAGYEVELGE